MAISLPIAVTLSLVLSVVARCSCSLLNAQCATYPMASLLLKLCAQSGAQAMLMGRAVALFGALLLRGSLTQPTPLTALLQPEPHANATHNATPHIHLWNATFNTTTDLREHVRHPQPHPPIGITEPDRFVYQTCEVPSCSYYYGYGCTIFTAELSLRPAYSVLLHLFPLLLSAL